MKQPGQSLDTLYVKQALKLAKKGLGKTNPNPMVGAVIVRGDSVIGSGYHHQAGKAHAEIEALRSIKGTASGATLYVNLEPCSHQGRTPSCVEAILAAGVSRVVCSTLDPNPLVSGSGVARLRASGIQVSVGTLSKQARTLNEAFFGFHENHRPFVAIKFAASLDGKIATASHDSKWITSEKARQYARILRSQYQAVMVGVNTVIHDDPHLGARQPGKTDPLRIILDSSLRMPLKSQALRDSNVLIVTTRRASKAKQKALTERGIPIFICKGDNILLPEVMKELVQREIISVLVEGGGAILGSFVDSRLVDKVYAFYGPLIIGGTESVAAIAGHGASSISQSLRLTDRAHKKLNDTFLISGYIKPTIDLR
jgi:diaminohydroxyphosphoribosylaminopyrimidine deaminase / 5-amino-6-(5-phosphoribosylamino)uracil reductase